MIEGKSGVTKGLQTSTISSAKWSEEHSIWYNGLDDLDDHLKTHPAVHVSHVYLICNEYRTVRCNICRKKFTSQANLELHERKAHCTVVFSNYV